MVPIAGPMGAPGGLTAKGLEGCPAPSGAQEARQGELGKISAQTGTCAQALPSLALVR